MKRSVWCVCLWCVCLMAVCGGVCPGVSAAEELRWVPEGPYSTFSARGGMLATTGVAGYPNWVRSEREYENVRVRFEYKLSQWTEAAIVLRAPRSERPLRAGIALYLADDFRREDTAYTTGSVMGVLKPRKQLPQSYEQWHKAEVELRGQRLRFVIDGETMQDLDMSAVEGLRDKPKRGYIGFPDLLHAYSIRGLEIEELAGETARVDLWNGRDLKGWSARGAGEWAVRDGAIVGAHSDGILYAPGAFRDFVLEAQFRSRAHVNSGIFVRGDAEGAQRGFELQIYSIPDAAYTTGSVYGIARSKVTDLYEDRWVHLQARVVGRSVKVWLDGEIVSETAELPEQYVRAGRVGLQIHSINSSVEFRDVRVWPMEGSR
ncbi:MAG: DUF1080 domain-containing protein [Acidobacteria bacterium]|nr:DUF1080 domain-containing protein [Acidobacteriota bacterium]